MKFKVGCVYYNIIAPYQYETLEDFAIRVGKLVFQNLVIEPVPDDYVDVRKD